MLRQFDTYSVNLFAYGFLYLTVISLWFPKRKVRIQLWYIFLFISISFGLWSQQIKLIGMFPVILLPIAIYYNRVATNIISELFSFVLVIIISLGLATQFLPGFNNFKVVDHVYLSKNAIPFTLYLNFGIPLVGIYILGIHHQLISTINDWMALFKKSIFFIAIFIPVIILLAIFFNFVRFDLKLPNQFLLWCITNLLFVSVAEEAFFRGFLQKNLTLMMNKIRYGNYLAIVCVSCMFGFAHYMGGVKYVLLAIIAGVGYGLIYDRIKRIEAPILTHFSLNLVHIIFFTYPMLASN